MLRLIFIGLGELEELVTMNAFVYDNHTTLHHELVVFTKADE
jgi:hypothetical protein